MIDMYASEVGVGNRVSYYKPSGKTAKRKNNQIILLPPF